MKKILLITAFLGLSGFIQAQYAVFTELKTKLHATHPELQLDDKIIAVSFWSLKDGESRACNQSYEKAYITFYQAKLKGGPKGMLVVCVNKDNLTEMAVIALRKDGVVKAVSLSSLEFSVTELDRLKNVVFDAQGDRLVQNQNAEEIFTFFNSLITR